MAARKATLPARRTAALGVTVVALGLGAWLQPDAAARPSSPPVRASQPVVPSSTQPRVAAHAGKRSVTAARVAGGSKTTSARPSIPVFGAGPLAETTDITATFRFVSRTQGATFRCALDAAAAKPCTSPKLITGLATGRHTFSVRAVIGAQSSTAAVRVWTITPRVAAPAEPSPDPAPPASPAPVSPSPPSAGPPPVSVPPSPAPSGSTGTRIASPPRAPTGYAVPVTAVRVRNGAELAAALAATAPHDIVLADGVYEQPTFFENVYGHRIYAEHLGEAVFRSGLVFGHNWGLGGGLVQGVVVDVSDPARTLQSSLIHVWGLARSTRILDVTLKGHGTVASGIDVRQPSGVVIQRVIASRFTDYGVRVDANELSLDLDQRALIEDVDASSVSRSVPMSSNGTAEACLWVGNTATVRRVRARDCGWMGVWSGTASHDSLFEDVDIDRTSSGVGMYAEHFSRGSTYQRLHVGPNIIRGMICEWADPGWGSKPACVDTVVQDSVFDTTCAGVVLDEGTTRTTVRRTTFLHQRWSAIDDFRGVNNLWDVAGNNYAGIAPGAATVSRAHHGEACPNPQEKLSSGS